MIACLKKANVTQRYCSLCLNDDGEGKHNPSSMKVDDDIVLYFSPTIVCSYCGQNVAFEWAGHSCEVHDYARRSRDV